MIPRKFNLITSSLYNKAHGCFELNVFSLSDICNDLDEFLCKYFKGSFTFSAQAPKNAKIYFSVDLIAMMLAYAFEAAGGNYMLHISLKSEHGYALIEIRADADIFEDCAEEQFSDGAKLCLAEFESSNSRLLYKSKLIKMPICNLRQGEQRAFYNALANRLLIK